MFVVPGPDKYTIAQGVHTSDPGAMDARTTEFLMTSLDDFVPLPDMTFAPVLSAFATAMKDVKPPLPAELLDIPIAQVRTLDDALLRFIASDDAIPALIAVALLLNFLATQVNPASVHGAFLSPFARLSYAEKEKAMGMLEGPDSDLVARRQAYAPAAARLGLGAPQVRWRRAVRVRRLRDLQRVGEARRRDAPARRETGRPGSAARCDFPGKGGLESVGLAQRCRRSVRERQRSARTLANREYLVRKAAALARGAGAKKVYRLDWPGLILHVQSTMRMGESADDSVLDASAEARWVKRLFVADNSAVANCLGGPNPTLTSQALATRTAETIFMRYFGGDAWVGHESPVVSTDPRVSAGLVAQRL